MQQQYTKVLQVRYQTHALEFVLICTNSVKDKYISSGDYIVLVTSYSIECAQYSKCSGYFPKQKSPIGIFHMH